MKFTSQDAVLSIDAELVARALPFRAYGDIRYYLNAICIEPEPSGGANVLATDGHALICLHDPKGTARERVILPIGKGQRTLLKRGNTLHMDKHGRAYIASEYKQPVWISAELRIEGTFPDARAVFGGTAGFEPGFTGAVNPALLDRIRQARKPGGRYTAPVRMFHRKEAGDRSVIAASFGADGFALIMPMSFDERQYDIHTSVPDSYRNAPATAKAADQADQAEAA